MSNARKKKLFAKLSSSHFVFVRFSFPISPFIALWTDDHFSKASGKVWSVAAFLLFQKRLHWKRQEKNWQTYTGVSWYKYCCCYCNQKNKITQNVCPIVCVPRAHHLRFPYDRLLQRIFSFLHRKIHSFHHSMYRNYVLYFSASRISSKKIVQLRKRTKRTRNRTHTLSRRIRLRNACKSTKIQRKRKKRNKIDKRKSPFETILLALVRAMLSDFVLKL